MQPSNSSSDSYIVVEKMIRLGELVYSELEHLLKELERQELITPSEHGALLRLARKLNLDRSPRE
jgi:uncharacterized protein YpbB